MLEARGGRRGTKPWRLDPTAELECGATRLRGRARAPGPEGTNCPELHTHEPQARVGAPKRGPRLMGRARAPSARARGPPRRATSPSVGGRCFLPWEIP